VTRKLLQPIGFWGNPHSFGTLLQLHQDLELSTHNEERYRVLGEGGSDYLEPAFFEKEASKTQTFQGKGIFPFSRNWDEGIV